MKTTKKFNVIAHFSPGTPSLTIAKAKARMQYAATVDYASTPESPADRLDCFGGLPKAAETNPEKLAKAYRLAKDNGDLFHEVEAENLAELVAAANEAKTLGILTGNIAARQTKRLIAAAFPGLGRVSQAVIDEVINGLCDFYYSY